MIAVTKRLGRDKTAMLIWLFFTLIGPWIGSITVVTLLAMAAQGFTELSPLADLFLALPTVTLETYPAALLLGGIQSCVIGIVAAVSFRKWGRISFWAVMAASAAAAATLLTLSLLTAGKLPNPELAALVTVPHLAAGFGCWFLLVWLRDPDLFEGRKARQATGERI